MYLDMGSLSDFINELKGVKKKDSIRLGIIEGTRNTEAGPIVTVQIVLTYKLNKEDVLRYVELHNGPLAYFNDELKSFAKRMEERKNEIVKELNQNGFNVKSGVWTI